MSLDAQRRIMPVSNALNDLLPKQPLRSEHQEQQRRFCYQCAGEQTKNTDNFQWQVSVDGGANFNDISDGSEYSGTQTDILTLLTPDLDKSGHVYRVLLTNDTFICGQTISEEVVLNVGPRTIITNRRITIRVNRN